LGIANGSFSHNQLAAMTLNVLSSVFLSEDITANIQQTMTVLKSALVLSHRSEDFYSNILSLNLLSILYEKKSDPINQSYNLSYKTQKEQELAKELQSVENSPDTIRLLTKFLPVQTPIKAKEPQHQNKKQNENNTGRKRVLGEVN